MIKVGRITAALLLVTVGALLLFDQINHTNYLTLLLTWWPLVLISWGLEAIWFGLIQSNRRWKFDILGLFSAVFIVAIVITMAQPNLFRDWIRNIQFDFSMMKQMVMLDGTPYELPKLSEPLPSDLEALHIDHSIGDIYVKTGEVEQLELAAIVTVYDQSKERAEELVDSIRMHIAKDKKTNQWTIQTSGLDLLIQQGEKLKVDVQVTLPANLMMPVNIEIRDGDIYAQQWNGAIHAATDDGDIWGDELRGDVQFVTNHGDIEVNLVEGAAFLKTNNGDIAASGVTGDLQMESKSGDLRLREASRDVQAVSLNGDIDLQSTVMGGDWQIQALAGDIDVRLPQELDARIEVSNSFGDLDSTYPLSIQDRSISGILGTGEHLLTIEANGDIALTPLN